MIYISENVHNGLQIRRPGLSQQDNAEKSFKLFLILNFMNDSLKYFIMCLITKTHLPNVFLLTLQL